MAVWAPNNVFHTIQDLNLAVWYGNAIRTIIARLGGQYGEIFSSRVVVLARLKGGTIQNQRAECFPTKEYCTGEHYTVTNQSDRSYNSSHIINWIYFAREYFCQS